MTSVIVGLNSVEAAPPATPALRAVGAVAAEFVLLGVFLGFPPLARLLGGSWPTTFGWALAFCAVPIVIMVDASYKALRRSRSREPALASVGITSGGRR